MPENIDNSCLGFKKKSHNEDGVDFMFVYKLRDMRDVHEVA